MAESRLIGSLPEDLRKEMLADLQPVELAREDLVVRAGERVDFVYFPTSCLISMVVILESGSTVEATTIGNDSYVGIDAFLGMERATVTCLVQIAGEALRMPAAGLRSRLDDPRLRLALGRETGRIFGDTAQSTACLGFHGVRERLARWLLMVRDGTERDEFPLTQDFMAVMLGVHRPTVTLAVRSMESTALVEHRRGRIRILDAEGLRDAACECYRGPVATGA